VNEQQARTFLEERRRELLGEMTLIRDLLGHENLLPYLLIQRRAVIMQLNRIHEILGMEPPKVDRLRETCYSKHDQRR
jgi:hypothetical protein